MWLRGEWRRWRVSPSCGGIESLGFKVVNESSLQLFITVCPLPGLFVDLLIPWWLLLGWLKQYNETNVSGSVCVGCYSGSGFSSWTGGSCDFGSVKSFSPLVRLADCGLVLGLQLFYALTMLSMVV
ncbi:hypothetical protein DY000_02029982 [Brassica cretica]|uniref:Uncharacterized protein n=1 Tax=Brassica cretica TaxID=69181 RepID=A0ABQ7DS68_BRACR|nr:hypothetical protein DY000_02029982 [Brassica cretica]